MKHLSKGIIASVASLMMLTSCTSVLTRNDAKLRLQEMKEKLENSDLILPSKLMATNHTYAIETGRSISTYLIVDLAKYYLYINNSIVKDNGTIDDVSTWFYVENELFYQAVDRNEDRSYMKSDDGINKWKQNFETMRLGDLFSATPSLELYDQTISMISSLDSTKTENIIEEKYFSSGKDQLAFNLKIKTDTNNQTLKAEFENRLIKSLYKIEQDLDNNVKELRDEMYFWGSANTTKPDLSQFIEVI